MRVAPPTVKDAVAKAKAAGTYAAVFEKLANFTLSSGSWDEFVLTITQERSVEHGTIHRSMLGKGDARTHTASVSRLGSNEKKRKERRHTCARETCGRGPCRSARSTRGAPTTEV